MLGSSGYEFGRHGAVGQALLFRTVKGDGEVIDPAFAVYLAGPEGFV